MSWEVNAQILISAFTNLTLIPAIVYAYKKKQSYVFIITLAGLITSILYHICDAWENAPGTRVVPTLMGMNAGSWHRLDNVFAILMVQSMFLYFSDFRAATTNDAVRWSCLTACLFFQELSPWNLLCTVLPILLAAGIMLSKFVFTQQLPTIDKMNLLMGTLACAVGIFFFHRGLDDGNDYLRINHSMWHAMGGVATYFWYRCKVEGDYRASAKIM